MAQGKRDRLSAEQRIEMWRRWKSGESLHEIGRAFGKGHGSIRFLFTSNTRSHPIRYLSLSANANSITGRGRLSKAKT
jgi:hypothetical protein